MRGDNSKGFCRGVCVCVCGTMLPTCADVSVLAAKICLASP